MQLLLEASTVGISLVVYALIVTKILDVLLPKDSVTEFSRMIIGIFVTGFTIHLVFEVTRLNSYYCLHGHACKK